MEECKFAPLGKVFKILLTVPGAAAGLERDFSVAGSIVTAKRSSLDGAFVEMVLFLYLNRDLIPPFQLIPEIDEKKLDRHIPSRLRDKSEIAKFIHMDRYGQTEEEVAGLEEDREVEEAAEDDDDGVEDDSDDDGGEYIPGQDPHLD